jgi:hypothetical protein
MSRTLPCAGDFAEWSEYASRRAAQDDVTVWRDPQFRFRSSLFMLEPERAHKPGKPVRLLLEKRSNLLEDMLPGSTPLEAKNARTSGWASA